MAAIGYLGYERTTNTAGGVQSARNFSDSQRWTTENAGRRKRLETWGDAGRRGETRGD